MNVYLLQLLVCGQVTRDCGALVYCHAAGVVLVRSLVYVVGVVIALGNPRQYLNTSD
jgi:hypothetical protein